MLDEIRSRELSLGQSDDPQWFEVRKRKVTASIAAAIIGANKYQSANAVLLEKIGKGYGMNDRGLTAVRHGLDNEPIAIAYYEEQTGKKVVSFGSIQDKIYEWLACSPDGITEDGILIEIKCPISRKIIPGEIPAHYLPQVQFSLHVLGLQKAHFVEFVPAINPVYHADDPPPENVAITPPQFNLVEIVRDDAWWDKYFPKLESFYQRLCFYLEHFPEGKIEDCLAYDREHGWRVPTMKSLTKDVNEKKRRNSCNFLSAEEVERAEKKLCLQSKEGQDLSLDQVPPSQEVPAPPLEEVEC